MQEPEKYARNLQSEDLPVDPFKHPIHDIVVKHLIMVLNVGKAAYSSNSLSHIRSMPRTSAMENVMLL